MAIIAWKVRRRVPSTILWTNTIPLPPPPDPDPPPPEPETEVWIRVPRVIADWLRVARNDT